MFQKYIKLSAHILPDTLIHVLFRQCDILRIISESEEGDRLFHTTKTSILLRKCTVLTEK